MKYKVYTNKNKLDVYLKNNIKNGPVLGANYQYFVKQRNTDYIKVLVKDIERFENMNFLEINILSFFLLLIIFILIMILDQNNKVKFKEIRLICLSGFLVSLSLVLKIYINPIISAIIPYSKIFHFGYSDFVLVLSSFFLRR